MSTLGLMSLPEGERLIFRARHLGGANLGGSRRHEKTQTASFASQAAHRLQLETGVGSGETQGRGRPQGCPRHVSCPQGKPRCVSEAKAKMRGARDVVQRMRKLMFGDAAYIIQAGSTFLPGFFFGRRDSALSQV